MYKEYHRKWYLMILAKKDLKKLQEKYDNILEEITKTTLAIKEEKSKTNGSSDKIGNLIALKIDMEPIIKMQKELYENRKNNLQEDLEDLKLSKNIDDILYRLRFVLKYKVREIAKSISYTRSYTYELISKIKDEMFIIEQEENKNKSNFLKF